MRIVFLSVFAAANLFTGGVYAAEPTNAQDRATQYQREVRAALTERGWRIRQEEDGKIVAERRRSALKSIPETAVGENTNPQVRLTIAFRPDGAGHTAAPALASLCYYNLASPENVDQLLVSPRVFRSAELDREYREVLAEADARLTAGHRTGVASSKSVAMK